MQTLGNAKLLIVDSNNVYEGTLESLNEMGLGYEFIISNDNLSFDDIKQKIENEEIEEAIIVSSQERKNKCRVHYRKLINDERSATRINKHFYRNL